MGRKSTDTDRTREYPFGKPPNGPVTVFICHNRVHRDLVAFTFKDKALYTCWNSAITGQQFNHIVTFERPWGDLLKAERFNEELAFKNTFLARATRDHELIHYTIEQQQKLGIYP